MTYSSLCLKESIKKGKRICAMVLLGVFLALLTFGASPLQADSHFSKMVVFGDSFSDTGNAHLWTGGFLNPSPYFDGRASNGPVFVEQAAMRLGLPAPSPSLLGGTNYAFSGAPTDGDGFFDVPTLGEQIDMFFSDGNVLEGDELIVVQGGDNDGFWYVFNGGLVGNEPATAVGNIRDHITTLANAGGSAFVVPNILSARFPLIDLDPDLAPFAPVFEEWVLEFNVLLAAELSDLEGELGVRIVHVDQISLFNLMRTSPRFGMTHVEEPACPDCGFGIPAPGAEDTIVNQPHRYLFWDLVHPSARAHQVLGIDFARVVHKALNGAPLAD